MSAVLALLCLALPQDAAHFAARPAQDALLYDLALRVDVAQRRLDGQVRYRFRARQPVAAIVLDARPPAADWQLAFRGADGAPLATTWRGEEVAVALGRELAAGDEVEFSAELRGAPPGGFVFTASRFGEALAFTDHYSIRAHGWLPCVDHPGDRARWRIALDYPLGLAAAASGVPVEEASAPPENGRARLLHETTSDIPPYMLAIVVGPYAQFEEAGDPRLGPHLVYRQDLEAAQRSLVHHAAWLRAMEDTFGPYAYGTYRVIQCPTRWGGFEAPGNVLLAEGIFEFEHGGRGTLAHELAHMWFGDAVGYAEWREVWLSEGFASYLGPWLHAQTGGPPLREAMTALRDRWRRSRDGRARAVRWDGFPHPDLALNDNTYAKGAWVLHMLRGELGDEVFFRALRTYYGEWRGRSVTTADFVATVERASGRELQWFFAQWLDRPGCPELQVEAQDGVIVVAQVQRGEPYRLRVPIAWQSAGGARVARTVVVEGARAEVAVEGTVEELVVDPDVELLFRERR
jgi:aminopeptidase N